MAKILWAGPWNEKSAIAKFGFDIVGELGRQGHEVHVFRTEVGESLDLPPLDHAWPLSEGGDGRAFSMNYDSVIVNLGDHYGFHGGALKIMRRFAPVGIIHDAWMGHFLAAWQQAEDTEAIRVKQLAQDLGAGPAGLHAMAAMMSGAVIHGPHYQKAVEAACPGPVARIPLSFTLGDVAPPRLDPRRLTIATVGHINPNKRAEEIIRALGRSPHLRSTARYLLIGPIRDGERDYLTRLAQRHGAPQPEFTGWVDDQELHRLIGEADVLSCLRHPCLEGGSASLVSALLAARPALVSDTGHYEILPQDVVLRCRPGHEAQDVLLHLENIRKNPEAARVMGLRARQYALKEHQPKPYVTRLLELLDRAAQAGPAIRAARRIGEELSWMGAGPDDPVIERTAAAIADLIGPNPSSSPASP